MSADEKELIYEEAGGVAVVTFNRPEARNALTFAMYEGLAEICAEAPLDGSLKAIIVTGAGGKAFASGTDIALFRDFKESSDGLRYEAKMEGLLDCIERCPIPTIAAINGACTGGGAVIAAICDVRLATRGLKFGFPIARTLGNCLSIGNLARLSAVIGMARTKDLIFSSRLMGSEEALATGLISESLEDAAALLRRAREIAGEIAQLAPLTLRATKEALVRLRGGQRDDSDLIEMCYGSRDFHEGIEAFLAKRPPVWRGE